MRYKNLPSKGDVDPEMALLQGVYALDAAAEVAEKTNDVEGLLNAAAMWMKFSEAMGHFANADDTSQGEVLKEKQFQVGFGTDHHDIAAEENE